MTEGLQTLGEPVTDPTEAQLMTAEYGLLLNKVLNACDGTSPGVAIAACISAAFCIVVDHSDVKDAPQATKYLEACVADAFAGLKRAFEAKAGAENGDNTREQSEGSDQTLAD